MGYLGDFGQWVNTKTAQVINGVKTFTNNAIFNSHIGVGTTPSAWTISPALQVKGASIVSEGDNIYLSSNCFYGSSAWTYKATNYATQYYQLNGSHAFRTAPSGTAGNPITWTNAMSLDASGNLNIIGTYKVNGVAFSGLTGGQTGTAPLYGARAWVNFSGTGTVSIRASGNVSSITDNGTGNYTVNFTTAMPDNNYACSSGGALTLGSLTNNCYVISGTINISYCKVVSQDAGAGYVDFEELTVSIFR